MMNVWKRLPDAARRALRTFAQTFAGLYVIKVVGFLNQLADWAGCREAALVECGFPDVSTLGYGLVAAGSAAVVALFSYAQNLIEDATGTQVLK